MSTTARAESISFAAPAEVVQHLPAAVEPDTSASPQSEAALTDLAGTSAPAAIQAATLSELVATWQDVDALDSEEQCLATAIFFESRSESLSGQLAVANVILARAESGRFPATVCGVVMQPKQFSFVRRGKLPKVPAHKPAWRTAKAIAQIALDGRWKNPVEGALYFHASYSAPNWGRPLIAQIGRHIFYR